MILPFLLLLNLICVHSLSDPNSSLVDVLFQNATASFNPNSSLNVFNFQQQKVHLKYKSVEQISLQIPPNYYKQSEKTARPYSQIVLEHLAQAGHLPSAKLVAEFSLFGNYSFTRDPNRALYYYELASEQDDDGSASFMAAVLHSSGLAGQIPINQAKAQLYFQTSARLGYVRGLVALGYRFLMGIGSEKSCPKALFYYSAAANKLYYQHVAPTLYKGGPRFESFQVRLADFSSVGTLNDRWSKSLVTLNMNNKNGVFDMPSTVNRKISSLEIDGLILDDAFPKIVHEIIDNYYMARVYYEGDYIHRRNSSLAFEYALECANTGIEFQKEYFDTTIKGPDVSQVPFEVFIVNKCIDLVGHMYFRGDGVEQDVQKAYRWFFKSEKIGHSSLQFNDLGLITEFGLYDGKPNPQLAAKYFKAAADKGHSHGIYNLARLGLKQSHPNSAVEVQLNESPKISDINYSFKPVFSSDAKLRLEFRTSASKGHLASLYEFGRLQELKIFKSSCREIIDAYKIFIEKVEDMVAPHQWSLINALDGKFNDALIGYAISSEMGFEYAQSSAAYLLYQPTPYTKPNLAIPQERVAAAINYLTKSSNQYNIDSTTILGDLYYYNYVNDTSISNKTLLRERNLQAAASFYHESASSISTQGSWNLGYMYENGIGVEQDFHLAKRYYDLASQYSTQAFLGVKLSLLKLQIKKWIYSKSGWKDSKVEDDPKSTWQEWFDTIRNLKLNDLRKSGAQEQNMGQEQLEADQDNEYSDAQVLIGFGLVVVFVCIVQILNRRNRELRWRRDNGVVPNPQLVRDAMM